MREFLGIFFSSIREIEVHYVFDWEHGTPMQYRDIGPHLAAVKKSHGFSRVAAGTLGIFSSYGGNVHSKLEFVQ